MWTGRAFASVALRDGRGDEIHPNGRNFGRGAMSAMTKPGANAPERPRGVRDYVSDGWRLGGAALGFVLGNRVLKRFVLISAGIVLVASAAVAVTAVALRREIGPLGYVLVGLAAYYCLSLMVTATGVGLAGLVADHLDSRPVTVGGGWRVIERRRRSIAGWAVLDLVLGVPSSIFGSWSVDLLCVVLIGSGWVLVKFFAIPTIALVGGSPWATARRSLRLVRRRWGDAFSSTVYLWVRSVVFFGAPAAVAAAAGVVLIRARRRGSWRGAVRDRRVGPRARLPAGAGSASGADGRAVPVRRLGNGLPRLPGRAARAQRPW